ncbi:MAG: hypothetical protein RJQ09_02975 [Cyclobacteriaceae bacterium]
MIQLKQFLRAVHAIIQYYVINTWNRGPDASILVLRDITIPGALQCNAHFFEWVKTNHPEAYKLFKFGAIGYYQPSLNNIQLVLQWIPDNYPLSRPKLFRKSQVIDDRCLKEGVSITNAVSKVANAGKFESSVLIGKAGFRVPRMIKIQPIKSYADIVAEIGGQFIVRDNNSHGPRSHYVLVKNENDFVTIDWSKMAKPIAIEFIDTKSNDGYYRKYRYFLVGSNGVTRHLIVSNHWFVHAQNRIRSEEILQEEIEVISQLENPFHEQLNVARLALELDYVAFDYSIDIKGNLIIWEANVFPWIWDTFNNNPYYNYQLPTVYRLYEVMLKYYLKKAGIPQLAS